MPTPVTTLYARLAQSKQLFAGTADPNAWDRYLLAGGVAGDAMIATRSQDDEEILMKLIELQEWISPDCSQSAKALLSSVIADLEARLDGPDEPPAASAPVPPRPAGPTLPPSGAQATRGRSNIRFATAVATVKVDRRSRPVQVDGVIYPSLTIAANTTGLSHSELRRYLV
jgi:hypothetical protein